MFSNFSFRTPRPTTPPEASGSSDSPPATPRGRRAVPLHSARPDAPIPQSVNPFAPVEENAPPSGAQPPPPPTGSADDGLQNITDPVLRLIVEQTVPSMRPMAIMLWNLTSAQRAAGDVVAAEGRVRIKDPERFTGKDPDKLRPFIMSCELNFQGNPRTYRNDLTKITYAVAHLADSAQLWYEPYFYNAPNPAPLFCSNWDEFKRELSSQFGNPHEERDAERELMKLKMAENHKVSRYVIDFNNLATRTAWDDGALRSHFYIGLPDRIKDQLASRPGGPPRNLNDLRRSAQEYDALYWSRQSEKKTFPAISRPQPSSSSQSSNQSSQFQNRSPQSSGGNNASANKPSKPPYQASANSPRKPNLTGKLTTENKLTDDERQRRFANNLCLYCGKEGHKAIDCRLAAANKPGRGVQIPNVKGRAATVEEVPDEAASAASEEN